MKKIKKFKKVKSTHLNSIKQNNGGDYLMFVNITRNKLLINKNRLTRPIKNKKKSQDRCNHCGGLVRVDGELASCIMCARVKDHLCSSCSFTSQEALEKNKKPA